MQTLVLLGSGEFTPQVEPIDKFLLKLPVSGVPKRVSIFPTAAGREKDFQKWIEDGIRHFENLGAKAFGIPAIKRQDFERDDYIDALVSSSIVYFSGGHPGHLLRTLRKTRLWKAIFSLYKKGTILVCSSAGAMVMGDYVLSNAQEVFFKNEKPIWEKALSLVSYSIIPHFDAIGKEDKFEEVKNLMPGKVKNKWMGIDENTALVIAGGKNAKVLGKGKVHIFSKTQKKSYEEGAEFTL